MIKTFIVTTFILIFMTLFLSCGSLNRAHGEFHYNNNISKGQELVDLKKALDEGAISTDEFELMKQKVIDNEYEKEIMDTSKNSIKSKIVI